MYQTKNDLSESVRKQTIELLQARLADSIDLLLQSKQAHWNVKGSHFIALHELFDKVYGHVEETVDLLAERIVQLGGIAEGTIKAVSKKSALPEYPLTVREGDDHVGLLATSLAAFGKSVRASISLATEINDADTADIFTEVSRAIDKDLWFVETHLTN